MSDRALPPGSTIGILGGGQLGRMLALAAARLGLKCHILCPDEDSPAFAVSAKSIVADYDDEEALAAFAAGVDAVTYEFENVDVRAAERLADRVPVRPGARALAVAQDRLAEKDFLAGIGIAVAPYAAVQDLDSLRQAVERMGLPAVLKTRRFGYDGKGQATIRTERDIEPAWEAMRGAPSVLEGFVHFAREVSVIGVRGTRGETASYDPAENVHRNHILHTSTVPARIAPETAAAAGEIARRIMDALDYVGAIGVEFFVEGEGPGERLIVNEIAPRVHNSGHWTEAACAVSQFENHMRAVAGWPLGGTDRHSDAVMQNLIGAEADEWLRIVSDPQALLHLYGKAEARPGRKMGHVNRLKPRG
jgi:5-(carboxyamino)imidazole ribonucleotide synthase